MKNNKHNKCKNLLNRTNESFYWLGYLAADGSFKLDGIQKLSRIQLRVNDKESIVNFKNFLGVDNLISENKSGKFNINYGLNVMDRATCEILINLYNINNRKTYNPIKFRDDNIDYFTAYLIGFIDGDGSIKLQTNRKSPKIVIKCHSNWLEEFKFWHSKLEEITKEKIAGPKINNAGYCSWNIANLRVIKYLKLKTRKLKLPCLPRKWEVINLKYLNCYFIKSKKEYWIKEKILLCKNNGMKAQETISFLNLKEGRVYKIYRENK